MNSPITMQTSSNAGDRRYAPRTSLYMAASLNCDGIATPVKIRNLSPGGALVEIATKLTGATEVKLTRGSLIVQGVVSWSTNGRCGIEFSGSVDVQRWRTMPANAEQQRIDDLVEALKTGVLPTDVADALNAPLTDVSELSGDLRRAVELLENCGDRLAQDRVLVALYPSELQNLDIAMQVISAVGSILGGTVDPTADRRKFVSLRKSVSEALGRPR